MFANGYDRVYHFHLKKCGGTSLNRWLSWHIPDDRLWSDAQMDQVAHRSPRGQARRNCALTAFAWTEAVYTHLPLHPFVPDNTFCMVVLREPRQRLLSQISDWRREAPANHAPSPATDAIKDTVRLSIAQYLRKYRRSVVGSLLDNYLTRALAWEQTERLGDYAPVEELLPHALSSLEDMYHVVGLTERMEETRAAVCEALGLVHDPVGTGRLNASGSSSLASELDDEALDLLDQLTVGDQQVYAHAEKLFESRHASARQFDERAFETRFAAGAARRLRPFAREGYAVMSIRDRLLGSGFWGRDGEGTPNCSLWTGPATRSVLYFPCPPGEQLLLKLWIRGYAAERQRSQLRFEVDDRPTPHRFVEAAGWREAAVLNTHSTRPFVKLTILLDETLSSKEAGTAGFDSRRRGVAFDSYGWSLTSELPLNVQLRPSIAVA